MWLFDFLFGLKHHQSSPSPDEYPPDGSMQFMPYEPKPYLHLPSNFLHFEFGPNCGESDPIAIELSHKIIKEFCKDKLVLSVIQAYTPFSQAKQQDSSPTFTEFYYQTLQKELPSVSTYFENELCLSYLSTDYDPLMFAVRQTSLIDFQCFWDFYVFSLNSDIPNAKTAFELTKSFQYDMKLEYINHGPTSLEVTVNKDTVDISFIQATVKKICHENGVLLINPPTNNL